MSFKKPLKAKDLESSDEDDEEEITDRNGKKTTKGVKGKYREDDDDEEESDESEVSEDLFWDFNNINVYYNFINYYAWVPITLTIW